MGQSMVTPDEINIARAWLADNMNAIPSGIVDTIDKSLEAAMEQALTKIRYEAFRQEWLRLHT